MVSVGGQYYYSVNNSLPVESCQLVGLDQGTYKNLLNGVGESPFAMTRTEATQLGVSIAAIWLTLAVLRQISRRF
jgi:hypothetical protein